jgi:hypothetical protein
VLNAIPEVGEILALKRFIKNERRAVCIALWHISFSVSCMDSKFSYNPHNKATTLCQNVGSKKKI